MNELKQIFEFLTVFIFFIILLNLTFKRNKEQVESDFSCFVSGKRLYRKVSTRRKRKTVYHDFDRFNKVFWKTNLEIKTLLRFKQNKNNKKSFNFQRRRV